MKSRLLALVSALVVVAVVAPAAQAASTTVVVQQVVFRGPVGGNDEFIQLKNVSAGTIDIGGWQIWGSNNTGSATSARATVATGTVLPAGKSFLFTNSTADTGYSLGVPGDATFTTGIADNGGLQLRNAAGTVIDAIGATATIAAYREGVGLTFPTANGANNAFMRKSTPDTDNNVADFTGPQLGDPQNCGAACAGTQACPVGSDGTVPITSIQTLDGSACEGKTVTVRGIVTGIDNLYGSSFDAIYKADAGLWLQNATRDPQATTSSALFVAGVRRDAVNPAGVIGDDITITGKIVTQFGLVELVPPGVGTVSSPSAQEVNLADVATTNSHNNPLPAAVTLDKGLSESQDAAKRPYYRGLQGMRVTLPVGIATGGGTSKFREAFVEPGTNAQRLYRKNNQAAIDTPWSDAPAEIGINGEAGAGNPADPRLTWFSTTQVDMDLFDIARNVTGPLTYSFSFYEVMPQPGGPAPTIERGPINAAYPGGTVAPTPKPNTLRIASFNVENFFPVGKENDGHVITQADYDAKADQIVKAIRTFLREPDVIAVQEVAIFADGANALTGLAAKLGNYTAYNATNNDARGIAPGFLVKNGTTASNGRVLGATVDGPWASAAVCDLYPGKLFDRAPYALDISKGDISLTAMSNHFASQGHQNACRVSEAQYVHDAAATLQQQGRNVLVAGDLNDFEFSQTLSTLTQGNVLANQWGKVTPGQAYSYKFNGHLQTLDHILLTAALDSRVTDVRYVHFDNDVYERHTEDPNTHQIIGDGTGISDHDPPVVTFDLPAGASVSTPGDISGNVPATLALTLGTPISLGTFTPGVAADYTTTTAATVTSTGADAQLSVLDGSNNATGRLVNGTYALTSPLQVNADGGAFAPLRSDNGPLTLASWSTPVSKRGVTLGFKQSIASGEGLRTGSYAKTLTFTLSTTTP